MGCPNKCNNGFKRELVRILGHIHTFNDDDVIDRSLKALLDQTYPLDEILIVDNASTDNTLKRDFPEKVTLIRHEVNLGTSGAVITGFKYALEKNYDWIWLFDADTAPREDALEKLIDLYQRLPRETQEKTRILSSLPREFSDGSPNHALGFNAKGEYIIRPDDQKEYYEFDAAIWTGCLYNVRLVQQVGLPSADYVLDWGEFEYGYRGMKMGLKAFMHQGSLAVHNTGGQRALHTSNFKIGPFSLKMRELPPIRCYYLVRNMIYFWLYEFPTNRFSNFLLSLFRIFKLSMSFLLRFKTHRRQFWACLRGLWDGLNKNMHLRYS